MEMQKITLKQSEWLWALKRNKLKEYSFKMYDHHKDMSDAELKYYWGWIVKDILSTNSYLLSLAWEYFNMDFTLLISIEYPEDNNFTGKRQLSREDICWLMFRSLSYNLRTADLDKVIDGDWRTYWKELDFKFEADKNV